MRTQGQMVARWVALICICLVVIAAASFGVRAVYRGSWELKKSVVNHQYQINKKTTQNQAHLVQNNYNVQEGYQTQITSDIQQLDGLVAQEGSDPALKPQIIQIGDQACATALKLIPASVPVPAEMSAWIKGNCEAGAVSPSSPMEKGSGN